MVPRLSEGAPLKATLAGGCSYSFFFTPIRKTE
jgi:hypothetical protein